MIVILQRSMVLARTSPRNHRILSHVSTPRLRGFSNDNDKDNKDTPIHIKDPSLKGIGQVIFLNSAQSGAILLGSLAIGDPFLAAMAATGSLTSTFVSRQVLMNSNASSRAAMCQGLHSYNGCLVGCATAVFIAPLDASTALAVTMAGATASTLVTFSLGNMLKKMPQWTYSFNIVTLTLLLRLQPFQNAAEAVHSPGAVVLATAPLKGLSQIFVVESSWTGLGIVAAIASYSPLLAAHAVMGSTIGSLTGGLLLPAPPVDVASGLWGFNSALTSMGVAVFFVPTSASIALSAGGAAATACCFGALQTVFGLAHAPCLTLTFCFTMTGCYFLAETIPGLRLAKAPHSPEKNY